MSQIAHVVITLPAPPAQVLPAKERQLEVTGGFTPLPATVPLTTPTVEIDADLNGQVKISVKEVLSTGQVSTACECTFIPAAQIKANAADPSGFQINVTSVKDQ